MALSMFCATRASLYLMNMNTSGPSSRGFSSVVKSLKYAKSHEWARVDGKLATIGLSDYAQKHLGGIIHVELPDTGEDVAQGVRCGTVESVQASKGLHSSLSGNIVEVNEKLRTTAGLVNASPYEDGWIMKVEMSNKEELNKLMDYDEYVSYVENKFPNIDEPVANT
ncbi:PREDICTED: glycine cleavage system H protein, mitochondrial-like [Fragaria vesca subsp. vesca]